MCRIFGFRSVLNSGVHSSLLSAENALSCQSRRHPDGWGLAYYLHDSPHMVKSTDTAETDDLFHRVSGLVSSQTVLAHVRKATQGKLSLVNTHPFQFGRWTFAHNGNIKDFIEKKPSLTGLISDDQKKWCLGDTDSELFFHYLLDQMKKENLQMSLTTNPKHLVDLISHSIENFVKHIGPLSVRDLGQSDENYLTFVLTNGKTMIALNGGLTLYYSTSKVKCPERETCSSFETICETKAVEGQKINHLIISSEPLQGENIWHKMSLGEIVGVDDGMNFYKAQIKI
jgi:predicted glutamine amidotransferase